MGIEQKVAEHYSRSILEHTILDALKAAGKDVDHLTHADLAPVDEFHIGGRQATIDFAEQLGAKKGMHLLDIGCGIGGASRYFAIDRGCRVSGIDLTEDYVRTATLLSQRVGLADQVTYRQASALTLPFTDRTFDGAYMLHVGMNITDKATLFTEARRVLKPGGTFGIYDVMRESDDAFVYPVPWSTQPETNFIAAASEYKRDLTAAGFKVRHERSRRDFAIEFFHQMREWMMQGGPSPLGLQIIMGETAPQKVANMIALLDRGVIAPTEIICRVQ